MASQLENQFYNLFFYLNNFPENDWVKNQFLNSNDLETIKEFSNSNIRALFFNKTNIDKIVYETDYSISLDKFELNSKSLYNLFYLDLLIMNNPDIINYKCSLDFIKNINSFINNDNSENLIQNIILLKVENDLIKNYRGMDEYYKDKIENELIEMEEWIKNMIPDNLDIGIAKKDIFSEKIDIIYAHIIFNWLKLKKFEEFESKIINQLFLENIYLTEDMLKELCQLLDKENKNDFIIEKLEDLSDINKINFNYILLKNILKKSFFIYHIPFLYKSRTIILNAKKDELNELLSLKKIKDSVIQERIKYIIFRLLDSEYYQQNIIKFSKENSSIRGINTQDSTKVNSNNKSSKKNDKTLNFLNEGSNTILSSNQSNSNSRDWMANNNSNVSNESQNASVEKKKKEDLSKIMNKSSDLEILEYIKTIKHRQSQFKKLSNNYYISVGKEGLFLYNSLYQLKTSINLGKDFSSFSSFYYIYEINCDSNQVKIAILCKIKYYVVYINLINFKSDSQDFSSDLAIQNIFPIPKTENKYITTGVKGIFNITSDFKSQISTYTLNNKSPFIDGINIDNNTLALICNSIIPFGEDKLIFYNCSIYGIKKEISGYSFRISSNCLSLIENEKDGKKIKILLCACKKYTKKQKNGILLVNLSNFDKNEEINELFYETGPFEVDCFCPITIVENKNSKEEDVTIKENITIKKTDFFFVGGFDEEKREGMIRLYKINYTNNKIDIEFIQDIVNNEKNDSNDKAFEGFGKSISSIIQSNIIGNILVTNFDGNVYLFKPPNIDYFLSNNYL